MSAFRADIQALRAISVLLVLAFHVWPTGITGGYVGVDVFFVISGYLITGHLVREVASTGRVDLPGFYARRARRLLPAASLTLVTVGAATYVWMPRWTWATVAADMAASTVYAENWMLVRRAVDYHAQGQTPSPLQHFWSLAVEEQFYLGWPLLVAGVAGCWKRWQRVTSPVQDADDRGMNEAGISLNPPRRAYAFPMVSLCAISVAYAIFYTRVSPAAGYFMTLTRLHELGLGGLVGVWAAVAAGARPKAAGLPQSVKAPADPCVGPIQVRPYGRTLAAAAGLLTIGGSGFLYSPRLPFPGAAALVPALGAVGVIVAGEGGGTHALAPHLAHPWLQYIGDISYSLYLAHWPVVVVYPYMTGRPVDGNMGDGVLAVLVSLALAHGCKRFWEDRFRSHAVDQAGGKGGTLLSMLPGKEDGGQDIVSRPFGKLADLLCSFRRHPVVDALFMTALMTAATMTAAFTLHHQSQIVRAHTGAGSDLLAMNATKPANPVLLNSSAAAAPHHHQANLANQERCIDFFGTNASNPFPGAEAVLRGCPVLNDLPISDALAHMNDAATGRVHGRPHPNGRETLPRKPATPRGHVLVMGDSHAMDWSAPIALAGEWLGFTVKNRAKGRCAPSLVPFGKNPVHLPCVQWVAEGIDMAVRERPLAVVFVAFSDYDTPDPPAYNKSFNITPVADGVVQAAKRIIAADIPVLYIKTTPVMDELVPDCLAKEVARNPGSVDLSACSVDKKKGIKKNSPVDEAASVFPMMRGLSFDDYFCPNNTCSPVIGNVVVYRDRHHLTKKYALSLAPALEEKLVEAALHLKPVSSNE